VFPAGFAIQPADTFLQTHTARTTEASQLLGRRPEMRTPLPSQTADLWSAAGRRREGPTAFASLTS